MTSLVISDIWSSLVVWVELIKDEAAAVGKPSRTKASSYAALQAAAGVGGAKEGRGRYPLSTASTVSWRMYLRNVEEGLSLATMVRLTEKTSEKK